MRVSESMPCGTATLARVAPAAVTLVLAVMTRGGGSGDEGRGPRCGGTAGKPLIVPGLIPRIRKKWEKEENCNEECCHNTMTVPLPAAVLQRMSANNTPKSSNPSLDHLVGIFFKTTQQD